MTLLRRAGEVDGVFTAENLKGTPKRVCKDGGEEGGSLGHSVVRVRSDEEVQLERREGNQEWGTRSRKNVLCGGRKGRAMSKATYGQAGRGLRIDHWTEGPVQKWFWWQEVEGGQKAD